MIILNWYKFPEATVSSYNVYRSIIGFKAPLVDLNGKSLKLKIDGGPIQTITFNSTNVIDKINATLQKARAFPSFDGSSFIVRSNQRSSPGSVEIVSSTALAPLGLTPRLITEKSEDFLIANIPSPVNPDDMVSYSDNDGVPQDWFAISTIDGLGTESMKTSFRQAIATSGPICVIEGLILDGQGVRIPDAEVTATVQIPPQKSCSSVITTQPIITQTGVDGRFSLALLQGIMVRLEIPSIGYGKIITVPNLPYVFLDDLQVDTEYQM